MKNFALIGAAGFVAPRHMKAVKETGNRLVAAIDPHDSVGVLDSYFPAARFFTKIEEFSRHLEELRWAGQGQAVDHVIVCSPNNLHAAHVRIALRVGASAICEKPLVLEPRDLELLESVEQATQCRIYNVLQLRLHPRVQELQARWRAGIPRRKREIEVTYITRRGRWYEVSWKGSSERSGGLAMNIGIHFFDLLIHLAGSVVRSEVHLRQRDRMAGYIELETAHVRWFLSVDGDDLPAHIKADGGHAHRSIRADDGEFDLSTDIVDLHTRVYQDILSGGGFGIRDARPSILLAHQIRTAEPSESSTFRHPLLAG